MKSNIRQKIRPSIIDRLTDNSPLLTEIPNISQHLPDIRQLKNSVRRDLEKLFNARHRIKSLDASYHHIQESIINYGLPDLATINMIDIEKRSDFCRLIEKTVYFFEPRFKTVHVNYITNNDQTDRTLRFRIEAVLYAEPMPEKIIFDSVLEPVSRTVSVEEA